jgi:hypothetical protein
MKVAFHCKRNQYNQTPGQSPGEGKGKQTNQEQGKETKGPQQLLN